MIVEGVITAAGRSSRMSPDHKLLLDVQGKTVLERTIGSLAPFCSKITVVTGHRPQLVAEAVRGMGKVKTVHNAAYGDGMFSSVKAGLAAAGGDRVFYLPADCPFVSPQVFADMLSGNADIAVPLYDGRPGHPVLFSIGEAVNVIRDTASVSLKDYIERRGFVQVPVSDPGILWDIDTPEDYRRALIYARESGR